jgi:hypothetical protein
MIEIVFAYVFRSGRAKIILIIFRKMKIKMQLIIYGTNMDIH